MESEHGSIEKGINGDYTFTIKGVLSEAWERVNGVKLPFVAAFFIYMVIGIVMSQIVMLFFTPSSVYYNAGFYFKGFISDQAQSLLASPVIIPLLIGMLFMGIRRATDHEITIPSIFDYYIYVWPLVFASLLINVLVFIGFMLLLLPGIYLTIAYMFTLPLMVDKGLGIWEAMETSRKAVTKQWFTFFFYSLAISFIIVLSALPLGIGLIWTIPMAFIGYGILYRTVFGYEPAEHIARNDETDQNASDDALEEEDRTM